MEKRKRWTMRLVNKPGKYWQNREAWQPGKVLLTEAEVSAGTKGRFHVDDLSIAVVMSKVDKWIYDRIQESKVAK